MMPLTGKRFKLWFSRFLLSGIIHTSAHCSKLQIFLGVLNFCLRDLLCSSWSLPTCLSRKMAAWSSLQPLPRVGNPSLATLSLCWGSRQCFIAQQSQCFRGTLHLQHMLGSTISHKTRNPIWQWRRAVLQEIPLPPARTTQLHKLETQMLLF